MMEERRSIKKVFIKGKDKIFNSKIRKIYIIFESKNCFEIICHVLWAHNDIDFIYS